MRYLKALHNEINLVSQKLGGKLKASTAYFGGGTPSYLEPKQIEDLFTHLFNSVEFDNNAEITFELHPGIMRQSNHEGDHSISGANCCVF